MSIQPPMAAFGTTQLDKASIKKPGPSQTMSKYRDFLSAIHAAAFPTENVDEQTRLEWDNIEGEIMGNVLMQDILSGTMFTGIEDGFFHYPSPQELCEEMFVGEFVEVIGKRRYMFPAISVMNRKLNELMISWKGLGREEQIRMVQSFQVQMQESDRNDSLGRLFHR